jgi:hypothetical protein
MATVTRRVWLIATVTALFGLQAPLCALACIENSVDSAPIATQHDDRPCHQESSDSSEPGAPAHEDCGCELAYEALPPNQTDATSSALGLMFVAPSALSQPPAAYLHLSHWLPAATNLPPPDILLLKSTLIL